MALTKIQSNDLAPSLATTIAQGGGPKISNVQIANSSWSQLDDTAISLDGGYILINGSGFSNGVQVLINNITATSVSVVNSSVIRAQVPSANAGTYVAYVVNSDGSTIKIHYNGLTGGSNIYTSSTGSISASQWTHVAFVRDGSNWTWYINGIAAGTGTNSADLTFTTQPTYIGYGGEDYFAAFNGYIDDLRITKGVARYTSNFTVPDKAFPAR